MLNDLKIKQKEIKIKIFLDVHYFGSILN